MKPCNPSEHHNHLCHLYETQLHTNDPRRYAHLVKDPQYVCKSCGRVAAARENLCEPISLGSWEE